MPKKRKLATPPPGATKAVDIHLRSSRNPPLDFTLSNASVASLTIDDLRTEIQSRVEPTAADGAGQVPLQKIKILYKLKPVQVKTVLEVFEGDDELLRRGGTLDFGFMIIGGAKVASIPPPAAGGDGADRTAASKEKQEGDKPGAISAQTGASATTPPDVSMADLNLGAPSSSETTDAIEDLPVTFWPDLDQFLQTKLKNQTQASRLGEMFKKAYENR